MIKKLIETLKRQWDLVLVFLIVLVLLAFRLRNGSLANWDEAIYAQISKEMVNSGNWLVPHWQGLPWFEKPPIYMWLTALNFKLFGISEFAARLTSALAGSGIAMLTYYIGKSFKSRLIGVLAVLVLISTELFVFQARFGTVDVLLTFFLYLGLVGLIKLYQTEAHNWLWVISIGLAGSIMTKSVASLPLILVLIISFKLPRVRRLFRSKEALRAGVFVLVMVLPWHIMMLAGFGKDFMSSYVGYHIVSRATGLAGHDSNRDGYYYGLLQQKMFPWALLLPISIAYCLRRKEIALRYLIALSIAVLTIYTISVTKLDWYIYPIIPAFAIIIAFSLKQALHGYQYESENQLLTSSLIVLFLIAMLLIDHTTLLKLSAPLAVGGGCYIIFPKTRNHIILILLIVCFTLIGMKNVRNLYILKPIDEIAIIGSSLQSQDLNSPIIIYKAVPFGPNQIFYTGHTPLVFSSTCDIMKALELGVPKITPLNLTSQDIERNTRYIAGQTISLKRYPILIMNSDIEEVIKEFDFSRTGQGGSITAGYVSKRE